MAETPQQLFTGQGVELLPPPDPPAVPSPPTPPAGAYQVDTSTKGAQPEDTAAVRELVLAPRPRVVTYTDTFTRANGALGPNWTSQDLGDGANGLVISSNKAVGTRANTFGQGNFWTANSFSSNQYSEITVTTSVIPTVWIGPSVRNLANGTCYVGIYNNASGTAQLAIFSKNGAASYASAGSTTLGSPLTVGTKIRLTVVGNIVALTVDGVQKLAFYITAVPSGGSPGIQAVGTADFLDDWTGGNASFQANLIATDGNGVEKYTQVSQYNSGSSGGDPGLVHSMRVKRPTSPAGGKAHNFLYIMPVTIENDTTFGDALEVMRGLNAHNNYNLTLIEPSFNIESWYANHATVANYQFESFYLSELKSWVASNLATTGTEKHWVIGFSKSGFGGMVLMFKNPGLFDVGAFWDFPGQGFTAYDQFGNSATNYGTDANFQANYRMTDAFLNTYKAPYVSKKRIWFSGYSAFQTDVANLDTKFTSLGIQHTYFTPANVAHSWTSGWVPNALTGLDTLSVAL